MTPQTLPNGKKYWLGREWVPEAQTLQRKGQTLSEIAEQLDLPRKAVVQALYFDVVKVRSA